MIKKKSRVKADSKSRHYSTVVYTVVTRGGAMRVLHLTKQREDK